MNKLTVSMLAGISLFSACSAPKYTYNFGHYQNVVRQEKTTTTPPDEQNSFVVKPIENNQETVYASTSTEVLAVSETEKASRINGRIEAAQTKTTENITPITKTEHKVTIKELRNSIKELKNANTLPKEDSAKADGKGKSQLVALLLAIFLGVIGVHDFYLGHIGRGIIKIVLAILGFLIVPLIALGVWVLVDIILIAIGSEKPKGGEYSKTL